MLKTDNYIVKKVKWKDGTRVTIRSRKTGNLLSRTKKDIPQKQALSEFLEKGTIGTTYKSYRRLSKRTGTVARTTKSPPRKRDFQLVVEYKVYLVVRNKDVYLKPKQRGVSTYVGYSKLKGTKTEKEKQTRAYAKQKVLDDYGNVNYDDPLMFEEVSRSYITYVFK